MFTDVPTMPLQHAKFQVNFLKLGDVPRKCFLRFFFHLLVN